jgi:hypothetical protein
MNHFFELFGGPIAVLLSIISTIVISRRWKQYRSKSSRRFLVALLYWGPLFLIACMLLHNFQNAYRAIVAFNETGVFNFYYYSLQLFGLVVAYQSYLLLINCRRHATGNKRINKKLLLSIGLIILTTLPTFAFTPIGIIPSGVLLITFLFSISIHRSSKNANSPIEQHILVKDFQLNEVPVLTGGSPAVK